MLFKRTPPMRLTIALSELPRLISDLQYDSLAYMSNVPVEMNQLFTAKGELDREWIQVVLAGWQVKKLEARLPRRTLQHEYSREVR